MYCTLLYVYVQTPTRRSLAAKSRHPRGVGGRRKSQINKPEELMRVNRDPTSSLSITLVNFQRPVPRLKPLVPKDDLDLLLSRSTDSRCIRQTPNTHVRSHGPIPLDARRCVLEHIGGL